MKNQCTSCWGSGKVHCSSCGGRGYTHRLTANSDMDMSPCCVCGGTKQIRCSFCGGRGYIEIKDPPGPGPGTKKGSGSSNDKLEGIWDTTGGYYEFKKNMDGTYTYDECGALGKTGGGTAKLNKDMVILCGTNPLAGNYTWELSIQGGVMQGAATFMGFLVPLVFRKR